MAIKRTNSFSYEKQLGVVMGLRMHAFQNPGRVDSKELLPRLAEEEKKLRQIDPGEKGTDPARAAELAPLVGRRLGATTTQLEVEVNVCMHPLPTGIYHLLDPAKNPLVQITARNVSHDARRVLLRSAIQGISAEAAKTIELAAKPAKDSSATVSLLPTLLPGSLLTMTEVQRATLYVISADLDKKVEAHDTYPIVCLSRNSSFNAVQDPQTGALLDFSHYYGAWVTPYDELVQERIRSAADLCKPSQIWGYQGNEEDVVRQVNALYDSLKNYGIKYVNSVIDYGAPAGYFTQRTRLPRESLLSKSANCIDGTVLMASLMEGASLNPALVLIPGHAFVAWETWSDSGKWGFLETTMLADHPFQDAVNSGQQEYDAYYKTDEIGRAHV